MGEGFFTFFRSGHLRSFSAMQMGQSLCFHFFSFLGRNGKGGKIMIFLVKVKKGMVARKHCFSICLVTCF